MNFNLVKKDRHRLAELALALLMVLFWTRPTIVGYVLVVIERMPYISIFRPFVIPVLVAFLLLLSVPCLHSRIKISDACFVLACVIVVFLTAAFSPKHAAYIIPQWNRILVISLPMYLVGIAYNHRYSKTLLFFASLLGVLVAFAYWAYRMLLNKELADYDMNAAYNLLPSIVYLIYWAFEKRKWWYWIAAFLGFVLCVSYGTRGPILAAVVVFVALFVFWTFTGRRRVLKVSILVALILGAWTAFASGMLATFATKLTPLFEELGFSTRIFDYFLEGNLTIDNGRDKLADAVIQAIREKPLLGYGIMGDRLVLGSYVHNFVLEVLCSFGLIGGSILLLLCLIVVLRGIFKAKTITDKRFLVVMVTMIFVKLLFSDSFIIEPYFFLVLGLSIGAARRRLPVDDQR